MVAICHGSINPAETFGSDPYLTNPKEVLQGKDPRVESLAVGTSFAGLPRRRIARSDIPQLCLFKDGDMLGDLKPELSEQGNTRCILIPDPSDQRFLWHWQRWPGVG